MSKPRIFISTPCYDAMMTMQYTISLLKLVTTLSKNNIEYMIDFIGNESLIPRARNKSLYNFYKSNFTHLLFIDSDIEFNPDAVHDLLLFEKDVVCCAYPRKDFNWKRFAYSMKVESDSKESFDSRGLDFTYNAMTKEGKVIQDGNFIQVRHASTGFMMIRREIIEKLYSKHDELMIKSDDMSSKDNMYCGLFCCMIKNQQYLSEDYSFCERVIDLGGSVWINVKHNLNHVGKYVFKSDLANRKTYNRTESERTFYT
jgi:hypothetical protein